MTAQSVQSVLSQTTCTPRLRIVAHRARSLDGKEAAYDMQDDGPTQVVGDVARRRASGARRVYRADF